MGMELGSRREMLPAGSDMVAEVLTPPEGHPASGARGADAVGSVVIFHGRVEPAHESEGPPLGSLHGEVKALPKDQ